MRYRASITTGSLKIPESRVIADLLLQGADPRAWNKAIKTVNILQARSQETATHVANLIRNRLETMDAGLWTLVRDGNNTVATQALLAAAIKQSPLIGDFLDLVVRDQFRQFKPTLSNALWDSYLKDCRGRDAEMPFWKESTRERLRSSVFQTLAQAGFLENTKSLKLQHVHIATQVLQYLKNRKEDYVLRCIQVSP